MNWEAIGTLAEVVGAVAVVVSLVYLAVQIRQNTRQVEEQGRAQRFSALSVLFDNWRHFRGYVISDPRVAGIWRRGNEDPGRLDADDRIVFDLLMVDLMWGFAANWMVGVDEGLGSYLRDDIADNLLIYASPGFRAWWKTSPHRDEYPRDFAVFVDQLLNCSSPSDAPTHP
ncbi:MAG: hypothetical protein PVG24_10755 [Gammaproteobacteria bacterium]|jgi:hypothetical protein